MKIHSVHVVMKFNQFFSSTFAQTTYNVLIYLPMTFPREIHLLSRELCHAYLRLLMICIYVTSERFPNAYERGWSGIYRMGTTSILLTKGSFKFQKDLEIFPGACPGTDWCFVSFIGLSMHFGVKN